MLQFFLLKFMKHHDLIKLLLITKIASKVVDTNKLDWSKDEFD